MPKAHEVAAELRKLADCLDKEPEREILRPWVKFFSEAQEKQQFKNAVRILPRPLKREVQDPSDERWCRISLRHLTDAIDITASIPRSATCTIVKPAQPAEYRCDPILSDEEDAALTV